MKLTTKNGNDVVYTPDVLCKYIVDYFKPVGKILEPACGDGAFLKHLPDADWCEIQKGRDYFEYVDYGFYDWVITNPPFSKMRAFLKHSYDIGAKNILFLCPVNHIIGMKARMRDMKESGYEIKEILLIDTPKEFPQSGFQWGVTHINLS